MPRAVESFISNQLNNCCDEGVAMSAWWCARLPKEIRMEWIGGCSIARGEPECWSLANSNNRIRNFDYIYVLLSTILLLSHAQHAGSVLAADDTIPTAGKEHAADATPHVFCSAQKEDLLYLCSDRQTMTHMYRLSNVEDGGWRMVAHFSRSSVHRRWHCLDTWHFSLLTPHHDHGFRFRFRQSRGTTRTKLSSLHLYSANDNNHQRCWCCKGMLN